MAETQEIQIAVQEPESWSRRLTVTVPRERVQRTRRSVVSKLAQSARLPGFRKGRLPDSLVEKQFGAAVDQETVDRVIQESYREALEQSGFQPITQGQVENVQYGPGSDLTFEVHFEVQPELSLDRVGGFVVPRPPEQVGDGEVDSVLERLRADRAHFHPLEEGKPDYGDNVTVEITDLDEEPAEGAEGPEPRAFRFALGEGQAIPDIEEAILTLARGEEAEFRVRFPGDAPAEGEAPKEQRLRIRLVEAERRHLPELDDGFAQLVTGGEIETLEALRTRIRADLEQDARRRAEEAVRNSLVQQIVEANPFDVPASMVDRYLDYMTGDLQQGGKRRQRTPEHEERFSQMREIFRPQAEQALRRMMVVEHLADREGLRATAEDVDARVEKVAEQTGRSPSDVWVELEKSGQMQALESEITEERVFAFLRSQSTVA